MPTMAVLSWRSLFAVAWLAAAVLGGARAQEPATAGAAPPPSSGAQRVYAEVRPRLLQIRTLLKGQDSQASVGSGFLVGSDGLLITNYHVVSQYATQPARYRLVFAAADGAQGALQLLGFDVVHDVAVLRAADPAALAGRGALSLRPASEPLVRGERIYAIGNPLDVGFAVLEGSYNGLVERAFVPNIFFGGSLSPGMSGGPALDGEGRVIGVNVAKRGDGEQISFLVPARYAQALLERSAGAVPIEQPVYATLAEQLAAHQDQLTERFLAQPWRSAGHPHYRIPVPQEDFLRCWGRSNPPDTKGLRFESSECEMDSRIFVGGDLRMGYFTVRHEAYDGSRLGALRFAQRYSKSFANEPFGGRNRWLTAPQCHERFVDRDGLPLRAVLCLRAHKRLEGLFDLALLTVTLDESTQGVLGRFDAYGVSFDNAMRLSAHYLDGFGWTAGQGGSR